MIRVVDALRPRAYHVKITFDPAKRDAALAERGLDFADAVHVFDDIIYDYPDTRVAYPEPRTITFRVLRGRLGAVVWTEIDGGGRVISMRKANDRERKKFGQRPGQS